MHKLAITRVATGLLTIGVLFCSSAYGDQNQELPEAAMTGDFKQVQSLLDKETDVNAKDEHGVTALWLASKFNHPEVVRLLLERGAEVNAKDYRGATALMHASAAEHLDVVKLLLDGGANVGAKDKEGKTALIWASKYGQLDHVGALLDKGADPNAKDEEGETALMLSSKYGFTEVVELLKARGAKAQSNDEHPLPGNKALAGPYIIGDKVRASNSYPWPGLDTNHPIDITSKKVNARNIPVGKEVAFEGNVKMTHGDMTLTCDQLVIVYGERTGSRSAEGRVKKLRKGLENDSGIEGITASGNVKIVQNERMTIARKVIYDHVKGTITILE